MSSELQHSQYDELVERRNAAFLAFKAIYELQSPPPSFPAMEGVDWLTVGALIIMVTASVIVSGSRTVVEFGGGVIGFAAFAMLELGIVVYAYIRTKKHYDEARHQTVKRLTSGGMFLALTVAVVANIHATAKQNGVPLSSEISTAILLLVAVSAPILAFIAGDVLGMEAVGANHRHRKAAQQHEQNMTAYAEQRNDAFKIYAPRMGASIKVVRETVQTVHSMNSLNEANGNIHDSYSANSSTGYTKQMDARSFIHKYFSEHPERMNGKLDELVNEIYEFSGVKVGRTSIHNVRKNIMSSRGES